MLPPVSAEGTAPVTPPIRDDAITVAAIAVAAACVVTMDHEALGHGGVCLALGGHIALLTSVYFRCTVSSAWIAAAGPAANLVAGTVAWLAFRCVPARMPRFRLLLLMLMALSVFWEAGYVLYSVVTDEGDWAIAVQAALGSGAWSWKPGGVALGLVLYFVSVRATVAAAGSLMSAEHSAAGPRVLRTAWIAAGVSACVAAAAYAPDRLGAVRQASLEIGAASIPLWMVRTRMRPAVTPPRATFDRHLGWITVAMLVYATFVATLGRGIY